MNDPHSNNRELIAVRIRAPKPDGSPQDPRYPPVESITVCASAIATINAPTRKLENVTTAMSGPLRHAPSAAEYQRSSHVLHMYPR